LTPTREIPPPPSIPERIPISTPAIDPAPSLHTPEVLPPSTTPSKRLIFWLRFFAYGLPFAFLLYVLYWNFLPFGYLSMHHRDMSDGTDYLPSSLYLLPSSGLSDIQIDERGKFRKLDGVARFVFKSNISIPNATLTAKVIGDNIAIIPPFYDFKPESQNWDYLWDFSSAIPDEFTGDAFIGGGCMNFSEGTRLELASSSELFETDAFSIYIKWTPRDSLSDFQQILGHYNWEFSQYPDKIRFQIGEMLANEPIFHSINFPIDQDFFDKTHTALFSYSSKSLYGKGYIEMYIDGEYAGRKYFDEEGINPTYWDKPLSMGKSWHGGSSYFTGCIHNLKIINQTIAYPTSTTLHTDVLGGNKYDFTISGGINGILRAIEVTVSK
jgi:hypothetical protein